MSRHEASPLVTAPSAVRSARGLFGSYRGVDPATGRYTTAGAGRAGDLQSFNDQPCYRRDAVELRSINQVTESIRSFRAASSIVTFEDKTLTQSRTTLLGIAAVEAAFERLSACSPEHRQVLHGPRAIITSQGKK